MYSGSILSLEISVASNYPRIDFSKQNPDYDWISIAEMLDKHKPIDEKAFENIRLSVKTRLKEFDALYFELRLMVSERAKHVLSTLNLPYVKFYRSYVNSKPFYHLVNDNILDVLNRKESEVIYFSGSHRVMEINRYKFSRDIIVDPSIFSIQERPMQLFCTQTVADYINRQNLVGFRIFDIENPPLSEVIS